jgi:DNA-binding transcriptional LysR family regulator
VPQALAQDDLDAGRLVQPLRQTAESAGSYYVLCRSHQWETPPIRPFREWLFLEREQRMIGAGAANAT